jgi:ribosome-associated protein
MKTRGIARLRQLIYEALEDAKGLDISVLDVRQVCDFTDYMMIASGTSTRHVQSMADKVIERLHEHDIKPLGAEGREVGDWVLLDFGDVILHLMRPQTRAFYDLEKLWSDAKRVKFKTKATADERG